MAASSESKLSLTARPTEGSRAARRLRRQGLVPGVLYGGDDEPETFAVEGRVLRNTLARAGALLEVSIDGGAGTPVIVKDLQRHPVRDEPVHVDLLRVRLDQPIESTVSLELVGTEEAPGVVEGGILSQVTLQLAIEALPGDIPDVIRHDVSRMQMNDTETLTSVIPPAGVTLLDDPEETVVATVTPPTLEPVEEEIETETELVGEGEEGAAAEGAPEGEPAAEAQPSSDDS
jgi:large subunit ribosomal protein L25